jgi:hypothetical protein
MTPCEWRYPPRSPDDQGRKVPVKCGCWAILLRVFLERCTLDCWLFSEALLSESTFTLNLSISPPEQLLYPVKP